MTTLLRGGSLVFYGFPNDESKYKTWDLIASLNTSNLPWLCFSDFNEIMAHQEKRGGSSKPQVLIDSFLHIVSECSFKDLGFTGYPYTWNNNWGEEENVQECLDRFSSQPCLADNLYLESSEASPKVPLGPPLDHCGLQRHCSKNSQKDG